VIVRAFFRPHSADFAGEWTAAPRSLKDASEAVLFRDEVPECGDDDGGRDKVDGTVI